MSRSAPRPPSSPLPDRLAPLGMVAIAALGVALAFLPFLVLLCLARLLVSVLSAS